MKLKALEYFARLAQSLSFTEVADYFNVRQPSVSHAIKTLEEKLGQTLITRDPAHNKISLTPAGQILSHHAQVVIAELEQAQREISKLQRPQISFAISSTIKKNYFSKTKLAKVEEVLQLPLVMFEDGSEVIKDRLTKGKVDFALFASTTRLSSDRLKIHHLLSLPFMFALSKDHPFANQKSLSFSEAAQEKFVIYNKNFAHNRGFYQSCQLAQQEPQVLAEVSDISIVRSYIKKEQAIGFMVQSKQNQDIVYLPISDKDMPNFHIYLAYPKDNLVLEGKLLAVKDKIKRRIEIEAGLKEAD